jgi:DNA (cytosine-5)-methyltransferase 1
LRAGASYNYLLVNGERRLTPREMLRLQGFPEGFKIVCSDAQTRRQAGNSLPVAVARAVIDQVVSALEVSPAPRKLARTPVQLRLLESPSQNDGAAKIKKSSKIPAAVCRKSISS